MTQETNVIYCGDNLEIMRDITKFPDESVDLIYLDPPFFSGKDYEIIWGDKEETRSFGDRWSGGIQHYVGWMVERLEEMHRILKPTGSIYLHVDHHAVHYLKVEMDKIFGMNNFKTEITWRRCHPKGNAKTFSNNSDYILYYTKSRKCTFNIEYGDYKEKTLSLYKYNDNDGKGKYRLVAINAPGGNGYKYDLGHGEKCPPSGYRWTERTMKKKISEGLVVIKLNRVPQQKRYLSESKGVPVDNVWTDIENVSSPRYPTEKPEVLLKRIINASSNPGDIIFDPFCGCATTLAVAKDLHRRWIGIDVSPRACQVMIDRLGISNRNIAGRSITKKELYAMNPYEFEDWVCLQMTARNENPNAKEGKGHGGDKGIDGIIKSTLSVSKYRGAPIQIKHNTKNGIGINVVKNFFATLHDLKKTTGFIVAISFGKGAVEQVAKYKNEGSVEIILVKAEDIAEKGYFEE